METVSKLCQHYVELSCMLQLGKSYCICFNGFSRKHFLNLVLNVTTRACVLLLLNVSQCHFLVFKM